MRWTWLFTAILTVILIPFAGQTLGQSSDEGAPAPLGDVAKKNKDASKTKAKRVLTDDDLSVHKGPIPMISLLDADNTQDVLEAIHEFKRTHDAAETERTVHEWFDAEADVLNTAIEANNRLAQHNQIKMEAAQDGYGYGNPYGNGHEVDYSKLRQRQLSEMWAQRSDARSNRDNWQVVMRIQQAFFRVRCDVIMNRQKMAYDWFRIRNANGVGTY